VREAVLRNLDWLAIVSLVAVADTVGRGSLGGGVADLGAGLGPISVGAVETSPESGGLSVNVSVGCSTICAQGNLALGTFLEENVHNQA